VRSVNRDILVRSTIPAVLGQYGNGYHDTQANTHNSKPTSLDDYCHGKRE
jgi:hypothetical protein